MIVVTGATGYVGWHIVEPLRAHDELLLVSRDPAAAERRFPGLRACRYDELRAHDLTGATVIHLAARNNDRPGTAEEFRLANVDLLIDLARHAKAAGARGFVNLCSTHALQPRPRDLYGQSKQEGARRLAALWPEGGVNLYVPVLYASTFRGRLSFLNRFPAALRPLALSMLRQVAPTLSMERLLKTLLAVVSQQDGQARGSWVHEHYAADPVSESGLFVVVKRLIDLSAALVLAVLGSWLMLLIGLYVRLDSRGPAIFAQRRVGRAGRVFTCYKFRTMAVGTAHVATHHATADAVTRAGRFLRRTKLDELPQVLNVIANQMSLVGPRPCLPLQEELIARRSERGVLQLKPGITGLAQVNGIDMSDPERLAAWDDRYRAYRTLKGDLAILLRTAAGGGSGDRTRPLAR